MTEAAIEVNVPSVLGDASSEQLQQSREQLTFECHLPLSSLSRPLVSRGLYHRPSNQSNP
jgi:hypothetical protein